MSGREPPTPEQIERAYVALGVGRESSAEEIKRAYKAAKVRHHPDMNLGDIAGAERRFKEAQEAYEVLTHPDYVPPPPAPKPYNFSFDEELERVVDSLGHVHPTRGDNIELTVELDPDEARNGRHVDADARETVKCWSCAGLGVIRGRTERVCIGCRGVGTREEGSFVSVTVPAGARNGMRLRVAGAGRPGRHGGPNGDLFVTVVVAATPV